MRDYPSQEAFLIDKLQLIRRTARGMLQTPNAEIPDIEAAERIITDSTEALRALGGDDETTTDARKGSTRRV